jgi:hypothetical protein
MEVNGQLRVLDFFIPDTHWVRGWVGPRIFLGAVEKNLTLPGIEPGPFSLSLY